MTSGEQVSNPDERKFRLNAKSRSVVDGFLAIEFANTTHSPLPIIAVDLPASILGGLALDHTWLTEDDAWRAVLIGIPNEDRRYAEVVRDAVRTRGAGPSGGRGGGWVWLFSVRESRVRLFPRLLITNPECIVLTQLLFQGFLLQSGKF